MEVLEVSPFTAESCLLPTTQRELRQEINSNTLDRGHPSIESSAQLDTHKLQEKVWCMLVDASDNNQGMEKIATMVHNIISVKHTNYVIFSIYLFSMQ